MSDPRNESAAPDEQNAPAPAAPVDRPTGRQDGPASAGWASPSSPAPVSATVTAPSNAGWAPPTAVVDAPPPPAASAPSAGSSPSASGGSGLAITSLVLGAFALLLAVVPFACFAAFLPAVAGAVIGIVALAGRRNGRGLAITGLSLSGAAIVIAIAMSVVTSFIVTSFAEDVEKSGGIESWVDEGASPGTTPLDEILTPATVQRGTGDDSITVAPYDGVGDYGYARFSATGTGTFIVIGRDADGAEVERVVDATAPYEGSQLWNLSLDYEITTFEIISEGPWTVSVQSLDAVPEIDNGESVDQTSDAVYWYGGADTDLTLAPAGEASGYLWSTSSTEPWLCESDLGANCTAELPGDGGAFIQVYSDGDWTLSIGD